MGDGADLRLSPLAVHYGNLRSVHWNNYRGNEDAVVWRDPDRGHAHHSGKGGRWEKDIVKWRRVRNQPVGNAHQCLWESVRAHGNIVRSELGPYGCEVQIGGASKVVSSAAVRLCLH